MSLTGINGGASAGNTGRRGPGTKKGGTSPALFQCCRSFVSDEAQVRRAFAAVTAGFDVEGDLRAILERAQTRALDRRDVDEHVLAAALGLDEAETLRCVEPFHGAIGHRGISCRVCGPRSAAARLSQSKIE